MSKLEDNLPIFILDTNILLIDPNSIYSYQNSIIIIPISVIEELDRFKHHINNNGRHARIIINLLDEFRKSGSLIDGIKIKNNIRLQIWSDPKVHEKLPVFCDLTKNSNRVLSSTLSINDKFKNKKITLVTNDINLRIRSSLHSINTIIYQKEGISLDSVYEKMTKIKLNNSQLKSLKDFDYVKLPEKEFEFYPNQHVFIENEKGFLCRFIARSKYLKLIPNFNQGVWNITPRNIEQWAALDLLLDRNIDIIVLAGKAGTGKTLLALAAALESFLSPDLLINRKILVSRPIIPLGKDLGYLPGDIEEKILPWMQPIFDNLELLISKKSKKGSKIGSIKELIDNKIIELEALTYIRGRSIPNRFMIVDEAQNLSPHEAKTIITRVGDKTKLVLTGDPFQIDNPYIDLTNNGLTYVIDKLKPYDGAAHAYLVQGERSKLAELAANIL